MINLKWKYFKMVSNYLKPYVGFILIALVFMLGNQFCSLYIPSLMAKIVDIGIKQHGFENSDMINTALSQGEIISSQTNYIFKIGSVMMVVTLISVVLTVVYNYMLSKISSKVSNDLRKDLYSKIMKFSLYDLNKISVSSLITRTTRDAQNVHSFLFSITNFIMPVILMAGGIGFAIKKSQKLSPVLLIGSVFAAGMIMIIFKFVIPKVKIMQLLGDKFNLIMKERLSGITTVRTFVNEDLEEKRFKECNDSLFENSIYISKFMSFILPSVVIILNLVNVYVIWVGAKEIENSTMAVGDIMAFFQYIMMIIMSFIMLVLSVIRIPKYWISVERVCKVLEISKNSDFSEENSNFYNEKIEKIEFKNVSFKYSGAEDYIIKNVNFTIKKGETIGIIGTTGCGKSTLARILSGFLVPTEGKILFNDKEIKPNDKFLGKVGYIVQNAPLFNGDIEYNLKIANPLATKEEIMQALKDAEIYDFVVKNGLDKNISGANFSVSGGQRQRLSIARALLKDCDVYVFDDSFSRLDFKTDLNVRKNLSNRLKDKIVFVISHRIGTIKNADKIIVLDQGGIIGLGDHKSLTLNCSLYKEILSMQTKIKSTGGEKHEN